MSDKTNVEDWWFEDHTGQRYPARFEHGHVKMGPCESPCTIVGVGRGNDIMANFGMKYPLRNGDTLVWDMPLVGPLWIESEQNQSS